MTRAYARLQLLIPPDAKVLAVTAMPSLFRYGKESVFNVDIPGAASPSPGMPFFKGPSSVKEYLKQLGIGYIAYSDFDETQCMYYRQRWRCQADAAKCGAVAATPPFCSGSPVHSARSVQPMDYGTRLAEPWKVHGAFYLDLMDNIDRLAETENVLFCDRRLRLLRLK